MDNSIYSMLLDKVAVFPFIPDLKLTNVSHFMRIGTLYQ